MTRDEFGEMAESLFPKDGCLVMHDGIIWTLSGDLVMEPTGMGYNFSDAEVHEASLGMITEMNASRGYDPVRVATGTTKALGRFR